MKRFILIFTTATLVCCGPLPEHLKTCYDATGSRVCLEQLFDDLSDDEQFQGEYEVDYLHNRDGKDVRGVVKLKIDKSFYNLAKQRGEGNYPKFDMGFEMLYKDALIMTRFQEVVELDLTEYKFN